MYWKENLWKDLTFFRLERIINMLWLSLSRFRRGKLFWRVVRVVEGAALEMLCPEKDPGFESLTLRQAPMRNSRSGLFSFCSFVLARGRPFAGKWVVDFASPYLYSTSKPF